MRRPPRLHAPEGTVHIVARCNNREFALATAEDLAVVLMHLREMARIYEVTLYAYTLMSNHIHLSGQAPTRDTLGRFAA